VVASGGAGSPEQLAEAVTAGAADAALAAGIFHFGQCTIREVKEFFARRGIPVRPVVPAYPAEAHGHDHTH